MAGTQAELKNMFGELSDDPGRNVGYLWDKWSRQRQEKVDEWKELRNYVFATDTTSTANDSLGWKNSTTIPKLCQIRDNLHANYISALFPNDNWLRWLGDTETDQRKAKIIEAYMKDKAHQSQLRDVVSQLLYDYIDYGNCFSTVEHIKNQYTLPDGRSVIGYEGPVARRISPLDIVFNPVSPSFDEAPKIIRSIKSLGEIRAIGEADPRWDQAAVRTMKMRSMAGEYNVDDYHKALGFSVDGFGDMREYYESQYVELLTFKGDYYDTESGETFKNQEIIVIDRSITVYIGANESWTGNRDITHAGWRKRPDNLYCMGPLDNLVGMQYRIDHLENIKADALDLMIHPPLIIKGDVEPFVWGPEEVIQIIGDGDVQEAGKNFSGVSAADNQIAMLEAKMEEFAGAPKQAMGIRTPGEKTAFEVQSLDNAAGRIFQEKITNFEVLCLERTLNNMLAVGRAKVTGNLTLRSIHDELGVEDFISISPEDLVAHGSVRPIGARHFGEQATLIQNISQLFAGPLGQMIMPHWSAENTAKMVEDALQLDRYKLVRSKVGLVENADNAVTTNRLGKMVEEKAGAPS